MRVHGAVLLVLLGLVSACTNPAATAESDQKRILESLRYVRDSRTGICFAALKSFNDRGSIVSITAVPDFACGTGGQR